MDKDVLILLEAFLIKNNIIPISNNTFNLEIKAYKEIVLEKVNEVEVENEQCYYINYYNFLFNFSTKNQNDEYFPIFATKIDTNQQSNYDQYFINGNEYTL